jgi:hypothetical protein
VARSEDELPVPFCAAPASGIWDLLQEFGDLPSTSADEYLPAVGPGSEHPWDMDREKVVKMWRRPALLKYEAWMSVSEFDFDADEIITRTITFNEFQYESGLEDDPIRKRTLNSTYINEAQLSCPANQIDTVDTTSGVEDEDDTIQIATLWFAQVEGTEDDSTKRLHKFDGLYYPQFRIVFQVSTKNGNAFIASTRISKDQEASGDFTSFADKFTIFDDSVTSYARLFPVGSPGPELLDFSLQISALKWLPYSNAANIAIYDEDTGDRI